MAHAPGIYPSVTQILAPWSDLSSVPPDVLAAASERGTAVHAACLAEVRGLWVMPDSKVTPYLKSFQLWLPSVAEVIAAEEEFSDPALGFVGHPDLLVIFKGDAGVSIIDLKTPLQQNPLWRPQIAAYKHLVEKAGHKVARTGALRLSKTAGRPIFNEYSGSLALDLAGFLSTLDAWRYFHNLRERMI